MEEGVPAIRFCILKA